MWQCFGLYVGAEWPQLSNDHHMVVSLKWKLFGEGASCLSSHHRRNFAYVASWGWGSLCMCVLNFTPGIFYEDLTKTQSRGQYKLVLKQDRDVDVKYDQIY